MHYKILKKFPSKKCSMNFHSKFKNYQVEWYFGNICNETCSYCLNKYTYEQYYRNMTHDETKKVCDFIKSQIYGLQQLTFIGGEPSCYKDLFFALEYLNPHCLVNIMTNGNDEKFFEKCCKISKLNMPILICCSAHYETYLRNPKKYIEHIDRLVNLANRYKFVELEFNVLLDKQKTKEYKELIEHLYYNVHKKNGNNLVISYVRRDYNVKETVQNVASCLMFDKELSKFLIDNIKGERLSYLQHNEYCGEKCPVFQHYCYIELDGTLTSCSCDQAIHTKKSIFDKNFSLKEEMKRNIICNLKHQSNNRTCYHVHGLLQLGDNWV